MAIGDLLTEYSPQMEVFTNHSAFRKADITTRNALSDEQEMEFGAYLLAVTDERGLDDVITAIIRATENAVAIKAGTRLKHALGTILKLATRNAFTYSKRHFGLDRKPLGPELGGALASIAGRVLGLELEGLSPEDREFEACKQFIRFGAETIRHALESNDQRNGIAAAYRAAVKAASAHAPGLMSTRWRD
jgi:hypothetical protein